VAFQWRRKNIAREKAQAIKSGTRQRHKQETTKMFEPGHLHLARMRLLESDIGFHIDITYRLIDQGKRMRFDVQGQINEEAIEEYFELPRETAFNFASDIDHLLRRHGALSPEFLSLSEHKEYDAMFSDIRDKLHAWHGETIDPIQPKRQ
tara:strand:- start:1204 stop:1653 length:450 start_codon:yes stop_codon:yes gene_type:complete